MYRVDKFVKSDYPTYECSFKRQLGDVGVACMITKISFYEQTVSIQ